tara:strand:+ start:5306 stop:6277 length:972 start_codon:yes stop_codon:yes gene_type:complete
LIKKNILVPLFSIIAILLFQSCSSLFSAKKTSDSPTESKIITTDIHNFYTAFDLAIKDTANAETIFQKNYFDEGSKGVKDFYKSKIRSTKKFADFVLRFKDYYQSIRKDISNLDDIEKQIFDNFKKFENLYPEAKYPDVYFVIGKYNSNGTISNNGLLMGTEIMARTGDSDTANWNQDILRISMLRSHIPVSVSHELVHFNQDKMKDGNTLLWKSIREGSAEFIAELISGKTDGNYKNFKGKELEIWKDFQKDKDKNIWNSWQQESDLRPRNAGYWAGYIICKAYYEQVGDKEKYIYDILHIKDYDAFYEKSEVDNYIRELYQ